MTEVRWILRVGEIILKSRPVRKHMRRALERHLIAQAKVRGAELALEPWQGLILAEGADSDKTAIEDAFAHTFGLTAADPASPLPLDPEAVAEAAIPDAPEDGSSFAVRCRRHGEKREWGSQSFAAAVGSAILERRPNLKVNLSEPDWKVTVAMMPDQACLLGTRIKCPGGLPTGVQGTVRSKLHKEMDYLAAFLVMRRGCRLKIEEGSDDSLVKAVSRWDPALLDDSWKGRLKTAPGPGHIGKVWAVVGFELDDFVEQDEGKVPLARLEPLVGWTDEALKELRLRSGIA